VGALLYGMVFILWIKPHVERDLKVSVYQDINHIVLEIHKHLEHAETTALTLANAAKLMPAISTKQRGMVKPIIKSFLETPGSEYLIAGGGVWPEPFLFNAKKERDSFFWGRNESNQLVFYEDYNAVNGPGYHHQEWYVPARFVIPGNVYWSKSYIDPYSRQPMVTATAPILIGSEFSGVSTVDVKLDGLSELLKVLSKRYHSQAFLVDRNLQLIAVSTTSSEWGIAWPKSADYFLDSLFSQVTGKLKTERQHRVDEMNKDPKMKRLAREISQASREISYEEGLLIASGLQVKKSKTSSLSFVEPIFVEADQTFVFSQLIPALQWTIIISIERTDNFSFNDLYRNLSLLEISFIVFLFGIFYWQLNRYILQPLRQIDQQLVAYQSLDSEFSKYQNDNSSVIEQSHTGQKLGLAGLSEELQRREQQLKYAIHLLHDYPDKKSPKENFMGVAELSTDSDGRRENKASLSDLKTVRLYLQGRKILLVDDDAMSRKLLYEVCAGYDLLIVSVGSGSEMWTQFEVHQFDAVVLDLNLPDTNGLILRKQIRAKSDFKRLPIIIMSASTLADVSQSFESDNFSSCFHKTDSIEQLLFLLVHWFSEHVDADKNGPVVEGDTLHSLNCEQGVANCDGNKDLYQLILATFKEQFESFEVLSKTSRSSIQNKLFIKRLNDLKISAAIIGAEKLLGITEKLARQSCKSQVPEASLKALCDALENELQRVLSAIHKRTYD